VARLHEVAAVEPEVRLTRGLPHVAQLALPRAGIGLGVGAQAPDLADSVGDREGKARALHNRGMTLIRRGQEAEGIAMLEQARDLFEQAEHLSGKLDAVIALIGAYARAGLMEKARDSAEEASDLAKQGATAEQEDDLKVSLAALESNGGDPRGASVDRKVL